MHGPGKFSAVAQGDGQCRRPSGADAKGSGLACAWPRGQMRPSLPTTFLLLGWAAVLAQSPTQALRASFPTGLLLGPF